jgi:hypothetical protein
VVDKENTFYARTDLVNQTAGLGWINKKICFKPTGEVVYNWAKDYKGFRDLPVDVLLGAEKKFDNTTVSVSA